MAHAQKPDFVFRRNGRVLLNRWGASVQSTTGNRGVRISGSRLRLKCDGTRTETRFRLSAKRTSLFKLAGGVSSVDYWQASCAHQPAGFVLLVRACVLLSCDAYWLPTPASCFPFTSPPVRHRVPSHFNWTLPHSPIQPHATALLADTTLLRIPNAHTLPYMNPLLGLQALLLS